MDSVYARRWHHIGRLCALSLLLSYAETFVPIPIPGVRLGLANIPVLVALSRHDTEAAVSIALVKVLASALLFGSPLTLAYALAGTSLSLAGMVCLSKLRTMRLQMTSIVGSLLHEAGQLLVAAWLLGTNVVWLLTPALVIAGIVCGYVSGELACRLAAVLPEDAEDEGSLVVEAPRPRRPGAAALGCAAALAVFVVLVFHVGDIRALCGLALAALACCALARVGAARLVRVGVLALTLGVTTLCLHLLVGTEDAQMQALAATLRLAALALACTAAAPVLFAGDVAGSVAWLLQPLTLFGLDVSGISFALAVALQSVGTAGEICRRKAAEVGGHLSPRALWAALPDICRELWERT